VVVVVVHALFRLSTLCALCGGANTTHSQKLPSTLDASWSPAANIRFS